MNYLFNRVLAAMYCLVQFCIFLLEGQIKSASAKVEKLDHEIRIRHAAFESAAEFVIQRADCERWKNILEASMRRLERLEEATERSLSRQQGQPQPALP